MPATKWVPDPDKVREPGPPVEMFSMDHFELKHLSVSQVRTFLMCGYRWWYGSAAPEKWQQPSSGPMIRGTSVDRAATAHFQEKLGGKGMTLSSFKDLAVATHESEEAKGAMLDIPSERSRDRVAKQAELYRTTFGEVFQPWAHQAMDPLDSVQAGFHWTDEELEVPILGIIDLLAGGKVVVDNKVKRRVPGQFDVDMDFQLTTYSMVTGWTDVALAVISDEDRPKTEYLVSQRGPQDWANVAKRFNSVARSIRAGILHPAPEGTWYCNPKWCPYWGICPEGGQRG